jgi:predicted metal-binding membrane protein
MCLRNCRSPLSFVLDHWRDGGSGSFLMGLQHGAYCFGCCWLLFVLLFPLGLMNVAAMGALTLVIFSEKSTAWGARLAWLLGGLLIAYGIAVVIAPWLLPGAPGVGPSMGMGAMGG